MQRRQHPFRPTLECLETRLTPANVTTSISGTILTLTKTGGDDAITIINTGTTPALFGRLTVSTTAGNTINGGPGPFNTPGRITGVTVNLGAGSDVVTFDGVSNGRIDLSNNLSINGSGGNKAITVQSTTLQGAAALGINLTGNGNENTTLTDDNVAGATAINHAGIGDTTVRVNTTGAPGPVGQSINNFGSLTINNGQGSDSTQISDTNFAGGITINNGAGNPANTGFGGGSDNDLFAANAGQLLTVGGGVTITTASGEADAEINDYNVNGSINVSTGAGVANQENFVGVENNRSITARPVIGGSVSVTGVTNTGNVFTGLGVVLGNTLTPAEGLVINGGVTIKASGTGTVFPRIRGAQIAGGTSITISGQGDESVTFSDTSVHGAVGISHLNTGNTTVTVNTVNDTQNNWGGLTITNGVGSDSTQISDTNFAGNVVINNGPGNPNSTAFGSGSDNDFFESNAGQLLTIGGSLSITTATGESNNEIQDYNVNHAVTVNTGAGVAGQSSSNIVDIENSSNVSQNPVIGGSVSITGTTVSSVNPGLTINLGTGRPVTINGNLNINAGGTGSASSTLQDLRVPQANTAVMLGSHTGNDTFTVQGSSVVSVFNGFTLNSQAGGTNFYNFQNAAGETDFYAGVAPPQPPSVPGLFNHHQEGPVRVTPSVTPAPPPGFRCLFGAGDDTVNLAANPGGAVTTAII
jgi:hypothetical protein